MPKMLPGDAHEGIAWELAQAVSQMSHEVINDLGAPLAALELLREHPGLAEDECAQIDLAIDRLVAAADRIRTLQTQIRQLGLM
jgi:signal transduction histidine kinase